MRTLRKVTAAALLACALAVSANAGEMYGGFTSPPPPPPDPPPASATTGEETGETADLTDVIVTLLNGVLSVF